MASAMVLLEHIGFGGRDRELWLYYWDERDGKDYCGWWCTPDYKGNNDYFLSCSEGAAATAASPADCSRGSWRSPNVEQIQLKRRLDLQFVATDGGLVVTGDDASTAIIPDQSCRVVFDKILWVEDGMHHGKPCYKGVDRTEPTPVANTTASGSDKSTMLVLVCGVAIGVGVVLAAQRWRGA